MQIVKQSIGNILRMLNIFLHMPILFFITITIIIIIIVLFTPVVLIIINFILLILIIIIINFILLLITFSRLLFVYPNNIRSIIQFFIGWQI